ncbi:hypothetical protein KQX54_012772, partial [Cotesia glomerata]
DFEECPKKRCHKRWSKKNTKTSIDFEIKDILKYVRALAYLPATEIPSALIKIIERTENEDVLKKMKETQNSSFRDYLAVMSLKSCQRGQIENRAKLSKISDLNAQLKTKQITPMQFLEFATNLVVGDEVVPERTCENQAGPSKEGNDQTGQNDEEEEEEFYDSSDDDSVVVEEIQEKVTSVKKWIITKIEEAISSYGKDGKEKRIVKKTEKAENVIDNESLDETFSEVKAFEEEIMPIDEAVIESDHSYYLSKEKEEFLTELNKPRTINKEKKNKNSEIQEKVPAEHLELSYTLKIIIEACAGYSKCFPGKNSGRKHLDDAFDRNWTLMIFIRTWYEYIKCFPGKIPVESTGGPFGAKLHFRNNYQDLCGLQAYIKTNFDIVKNQQTNVNYCCGSLVDKSYWKIEAKITQLKLPFINKFCKGQHVEIIGIINNSYHYATVHIQSIDDIVKIDDDTMSFSELMKANKEVIIEPDDNDSNKKFKSD